VHRFRIAVGFTLVFVVASVMDAQATTIIPIKASKAFEIEPESFGGRHLFAWTQTRTPNSRGRGWNVMLGINGKVRQISRKGSYSWPDGFDDAGRLIFQQSFVRTPANSDLFMWSSGHITRLPKIVNNKRWQYAGDRWGNWLVYGENVFTHKSSPWSIVRYNFSTGIRTVLVHARDSCRCVDPGNVVGSVTAYRAGRRITVQELAPPMTRKLTNPPAGYLDDYPYLVDPTPGSPDSGDEVLFFMRARAGACGSSVKIMQAPYPYTSATAVYAAPRHVAINSLTVDDTTGPRNVYFGRQTCGTVPSGNIYEIKNVTP
jgi:hypothetical protein